MCHDWTASSQFWNTISIKDRKSACMTEVAKYALLQDGFSGMLPTLKTPPILKKSANFKGVCGETYDTLLTAYLCLPLITGAELAKMMVLAGLIIP